jgi:trk system potassium uptake protein TrkH
MPLYDAIVNSFATAGTGGFSVLNNSIAGYNSPAVEWIIAVFMLLFGVNFNLFFFILIGRIKEVFKSEELRAYLCVVIASVAVILINTYHMFDSFGQGLRTVFFQVSSIITTTGFCTTEFNDWPVLSKTVIVMLMMIGACAGSTGGGMKVSRILLYVKMSVKELRHLVHPRSINAVRLEGRAVDNAVIRTSSVYLASYVLIFFGSLLIISLDNFDFTTNFTAIAATINNIGPGLNVVGPTGNFSEFSVLSKFVMMFDMLAGRLELFPMLVLISTIFQKRTGIWKGQSR